MQRTILVVDDNRINRQILGGILCADYAIAEAENGYEALCYLKENYEAVSAVLLDILMPRMDGYQVLEQMQHDPALSQIPVIVTTSSEELETEKKVLLLGATDFVAKPFDADILLRRLKNLIRLRETAVMVNTLQRDELTGLLIRKIFFEKAAEMIVRKPSGYYVMSSFDIDNFKVINDQYGVEKGDEVLRQVADIFREGFTPAGGICCRVMADNFAAMYPSSFMNSEALAEIRRRLSVLDGSILPLAFSVGRYVINDLTLPVSGMHDRAALAQASAKGRYDANIAMYDESLRTHLLEAQTINSEMKPALEGGQFEAWFQPQYNHSTGALIGSEALVRWRHPTKGLISPDAFIPVFERNGFVYELDKYIWEQVCQHLRRWLDAGRAPLPVSVNISRFDVFRDDILDVLTGLVHKYDIPVELLRLEITESAFAQSTERIVSVVKQLIGRGFTLEIDDFGSGYSSLNTLKDVPAQILKLDMRFLETTTCSIDGSCAESTSRGGNILESVVRMAKWLNMSVIAEGVETVEQANFLRSIGCSYVQGYLYAKPMPVEEFAELAACAGKEEKLLAIEAVENLDNNTFWSPSSMDTLIFNSYVGGACIFEYHDGVMELLRVNEKCAQGLGVANLSAEAVLQLRLEDYMDAADIAGMHEAMRNAIETREEIPFEARLTGLRDKDSVTDIRAELRVIARAGERCLFYSSIRDITEEKAAAQTILDAAEQFRFLNETARDLLSQTDTDSGIHAVLQRVLDYFSADRAYIIELDDKRRVSDNTYEVCAPGVSCEKEHLQGVPYEAAPFWLSTLATDEYINIPEVDAMPDSRAEERELLRRQNIRSLIAVPLRRGGRLAGFVGLDNPTRQRSHVMHLRALGDYLTAALIRRDLSAKIENDRAALQTLMRDTPEGFARLREMTCEETLFDDAQRPELRQHELLPLALTTVMEESANLVFVKDLELRYVWVNRRMAELAGFDDPAAMLGRTDFDLTDRALAEKFSATDRAVIGTGKPLLNNRQELPVKGGKMCYVSTSKYPLPDTHGNIVGLFGIGHDITEEHTAFAQLKLLTESIPGGLATYALPAGAPPQIIYFNDGLCRMLGCTREEYAEIARKGVISTVFREDLPKLQSQIDAMVQNGTPINCTYRAHNIKDGGYKWISLRATAAKHSYGVRHANAVMFDVTEQKTAEMTARIHEKEYRLAIGQGGRLAYRYTHADRVVEMPQDTATLFGLPLRLTEMPGSVLETGCIASESMQAYTEFYAALCRGDASGVTTIKRRVANGAWRWFETRFSTVFDDENTPVSAIILFEDITDKRKESVAVSLDHNRFAAAMNTVYPLLIAANLTQNSYRVIADSAKPPMLGTTKGTLEELITAAARKMEPGYAAQFRSKFQRRRLLQVLLEEGDSLRLEYQQQAGDGVSHWVEVIAIRIRNDYDSDATGVIACRFIDTQKDMENRLRMAELDGMTGVYNKAATERLIVRCLRAENMTSCAMLVADLDNLKLINDTLGHSEGDRAIKLMASLLRAQFRQEDIVGRIGGDEFAAFLCNVTGRRMRSMMEAFMRKLSANRIGENGNFPLHSSVGIAMGTGNESYEALFKKADRALYHVKRNGKDDFAFYTPEMEQDTYQYSGHGTTSRWQSESSGSEDFHHLLSAVSAIYPMVISVNLTQNSFHMLQYDTFTTRRSSPAGSFDELIKHGEESFHPEDRAGFVAAFSRKSLLAAHRQGERVVSYTGRQLGDDGVYRVICTDVIFAQSGNGGDVLEITLSREVGDIYQTKQNGASRSGGTATPGETRKRPGKGE